MTEKTFSLSPEKPLPSAATEIGFDLIGFDLDGTMVDSGQDITAALNQTLASIGRGPLSLDQVLQMVGGGSRHLIEQACEFTGGSTGLDLDALYALQLQNYEAHIAVHTQIFDGLIEALDALDALGVRAAVATNKVEKLARLLLEKLGLLDRFVFVIGGDSLGLGRAKPAPDMLLAMQQATGARKIAFVGDTIYDVKAAATAGFPSIIMDFKGSVPALGEDYRISHFGELLPLLQSIDA